MASQSGISVCRVTKPSKKPAIIKNGMVLINIFNPLMTPRLKDSNRGNVPVKVYRYPLPGLHNLQLQLQIFL